MNDPSEALQTIEANDNIAKQAMDAVDMDWVRRWTAGMFAVYDCPNCGLTGRWRAVTYPNAGGGSVACLECDRMETVQQATIFEVEYE